MFYSGLSIANLLDVKYCFYGKSLTKSYYSHKNLCDHATENTLDFNYGQMVSNKNIVFTDANFNVCQEQWQVLIWSANQIELALHWSYLSFIYLKQGGFSKILPEMMIFAKSLKRMVNKCFIIPKNTWFKKKEKLDAILIFEKTNNANSRLFWELEHGCLAWLPWMTFHPIFPSQNHIPWSYSPPHSYSLHTRVIGL